MAAKKKARAKKKADHQVRNTLPIKRLLKIGNPVNPRKKMAGRQFDALRGLHAKFGSVQDVIVNKRSVGKGWPPRSSPAIVGGHQRVRAAAEEGFDEYPVTYIDVTEAEEQELNIGLNNVTGDWEESLLQDMLRKIDEADGDLALTGFDDKDLARLLQKAEDGNTSPDAIPEDVEKRCEPGDLWTLGDHRLLCGDATSADEQARLFDGNQPPLCMTDPPYGVEYDPNWRNEAAAKGQLAYAARRVGKVDNDDTADWGSVFALSGCDVLYHWSAASGDLSIAVGSAMIAAGYSIRNQIIWRKPHFPISRGHYTYQHEPCWYGVRKGATAHWIGDAKQSSVWEVSLDENVPGGHSTQKPVELFTRAIANHKGDVFEPFCGSGTCLIACHQLSRKCYAMEISPEYCDVILARWEAFTGEKAVKNGG